MAERSQGSLLLELLASFFIAGLILGLFFGFFLGRLT